MLCQIEGNLCGVVIYQWSSDLYSWTVECDLYFRSGWFLMYFIVRVEGVAQAVTWFYATYDIKNRVSLNGVETFQLVSTAKGPRWKIMPQNVGSLEYQISQNILKQLLFRSLCFGFNRCGIYVLKSFEFLRESNDHPCWFQCITLNLSTASILYMCPV